VTQKGVESLVAEAPLITRVRRFPSDLSRVPVNGVIKGVDIDEVLAYVRHRYGEGADAGMKGFWPLGIILESDILLFSSKDGDHNAIHIFHFGAQSLNAKIEAPFDRCEFLFMRLMTNPHNEDFY
jgi:hypothetical protein